MGGGEEFSHSGSLDKVECNAVQCSAVTYCAVQCIPEGWMGLYQNHLASGTARAPGTDPLNDALTGACHVY